MKKKAIMKKLDNVTDEWNNTINKWEWAGCSPITWLHFFIISMICNLTVLSGQASHISPTLEIILLLGGVGSGIASLYQIPYLCQLMRYFRFN